MFPRQEFAFCNLAVLPDRYVAFVQILVDIRIQCSCTSLLSHHFSLRRGVSFGCGSMPRHRLHLLYFHSLFSSPTVSFVFSPFCTPSLFSLFAAMFFPPASDTFLLTSPRFFCTFGLPVSGGEIICGALVIDLNRIKLYI